MPAAIDENTTASRMISLGRNGNTMAGCLLLARRPAADDLVADDRKDRLALLVVRGVAEAHDAPVAGLRGPELQNLACGAQRVAGPDGFEPFQLVEPR